MTVKTMSSMGVISWGQSKLKMSKNCKDNTLDTIILKKSYILLYFFLQIRKNFIVSQILHPDSADGKKKYKEPFPVFFLETAEGEHKFLLDILSFASGISLFFKKPA